MSPTRSTTPRPTTIATTTAAQLSTTTERLSVPPGIEKLNKMLDPSKQLERENAVNISKAKYRKEFESINMEQSYPNLFEVMWYSQMPCFDVRGLTSEAKDEMSLVKRCLWKGQFISCSAIFDTRPTDRGMCCTFNMDKVEDVFKESRYRDMISRMQQKDLNYSFESTDRPDW